MAAFATPVVLIVAAMVAGLASSERAALWLFALAAPTVVLATVLAGDFPGTLLLVAAAVASGPLWLLLGRVVAARAIASAGSEAVAWRGFWWRYAVVSAAWVAAATVLLSFWRS